MCVKVTGLALQEYQNENVEKVVEFWYNAKNWSTQTKKKQKNNKLRSGTKNKRICLDLDALSLSDSDDSWASSTSTSGDEGVRGE